MSSRKLARHYDWVSNVYDILDYPFERFRYRALRPIVCGDLEGVVLDAGVGTGRNLAHFARAERVVGIDASRGQLEHAKHRVPEAPCPVELYRMDVTKLTFEDSSFDACVATFLFCVLPDELQRPALEELLRVLRPGATLRLVEYVYSNKPGRRLLMRAMSPYVEWVFGARFDRTTASVVRSSPVEIVDERFIFQDTIKLFDLRRR